MKTLSININSIILLCGIGVLFVISGCDEKLQKKELTKPSSKRPNIVFIMTDDHTKQAIGSYGSIINKTPNIDRIAHNGMRFDHCYVTNSICSPSRATILTGKYSHLNGVTDNIKAFDGLQQTFPKLLQQHGYETAIVGKWHLKSAPTGFDYWNILPGQGDYYNPEFIENGDTTSLTGYVTDIITNKAINWLKGRAHSEEPFLLLYQHKAPHRNWLPGPEHLNMYDDVEIPIPETYFDDYKGRGSAARDQRFHIMQDQDIIFDSKNFKFDELKDRYEDSERNYFLPMFKRLNKEQRQAWAKAYYPEIDAFREANLKGEALAKWKYQRYIKDYLRCVASVDDNIGKFLDYLEESGQSENTIVVYTSDQGFFLGEHGWFDKRFMYEESFSPPLLIQWPKVIKAGTSNDKLVSNLDFAETFLDAAGVTIPSDMQGTSLLPLFRDPTKKEWRESAYYHYYEYQGVHSIKRHYGLRTDRYKLIHFYHDIDEWELYDLKVDTHEMNNVYGVDEYRNVQKSLHKKLEIEMHKFGDSKTIRDSILKNDIEQYEWVY